MGNLKRKAKASHSRLLSLQKQIYRSLQLQTDHLLGNASDELKTYESRYRKECGGDFRTARKSSKTRLLQNILRSDVTFLGDFHTYPQSQRTALRLLRELIQLSRRKKKGRKPVHWKIGLELIPTRHQWALDDYQAGRIDLDRFHELIRYQEEWGFPWQNYAPIFEWAKENRVPLIALNRPRGLFDGSASLRRAKKRGELFDRDQWAAGVITDQFHEARAKGQEIRMFVLYGELHLARTHLPRQLKLISGAFLQEPLRSLSIFQNVDEIYWKLAQARQEHLVPVLQLRSGNFCVVSGTPWGKLQSLIGWAEGGTSERDADYDEETDPNLEFLSAMTRYGEIQSHFFGIAPVSYESLSIKRIEDADFLEGLGKLHRQLIRAGQKLYIEEPRQGIQEDSQVIFLPSLTENHAAEMAALHLFHHLHPERIQFEPDAKPTLSQRYRRWLIEAAFGFFGSLLINPKRKCDFKVDHEKRLRELRRHPRRQTHAYELQARQLSVEVLNRGTAGLDRLPKTLKSQCVGWISARAVGQILGKQLYHEFLNGSLSAEQIRDFFLHSERFEVRFKREIISLSKTDLL